MERICLNHLGYRLIFDFFFFPILLVPHFFCDCSDYVTKTLEASLSHLQLIVPLLDLIYQRRKKRTPSANLTSADLRRLSKLENEVNSLHRLITESRTSPYFALSWTITWFTHTMKDLALATRMVDFFIVSHPLMPVYVSVAVRRLKFIHTLHVLNVN